MNSHRLMSAPPGRQRYQVLRGVRKGRSRVLYRKTREVGRRLALVSQAGDVREVPKLGSRN
jgi:hypothetical protein